MGIFNKKEEVTQRQRLALRDAGKFAMEFEDQSKHTLYSVKLLVKAHLAIEGYEKPEIDYAIKCIFE